MWSTTRPGRFIPGKDPVSIVWEAGWTSGPVWTGGENLAPTGIRSPDRLARSLVAIPTELRRHTGGLNTVIVFILLTNGEKCLEVMTWRWRSQLHGEFWRWGFWVTKPYSLIGWSHWMDCKCCRHLLPQAKQVSTWEISVNYQALRCHNHSLNLRTRANLKNLKPKTSTVRYNTSIQHLNTTPQYNTSIQHLNTTPQYNTSIKRLNTTPQHNASIQHLNTTPQYHTSIPHLNTTPQ